MERRGVRKSHYARAPRSRSSGSVSALVTLRSIAIRGRLLRFYSQTHNSDLKVALTRPLKIAVSLLQMRYEFIRARSGIIQQPQHLLEAPEIFLVVTWRTIQNIAWIQKEKLSRPALHGPCKRIDNGGQVDRRLQNAAQEKKSFGEEIERGSSGGVKLGLSPVNPASLHVKHLEVLGREEPEPRNRNAPF